MTVRRRGIQRLLLDQPDRGLPTTRSCSSFVAWDGPSRRRCRLVRTLRRPSRREGRTMNRLTAVWLAVVLAVSIRPSFESDIPFPSGTLIVDAQAGGGGAGG